MTKTVEGNKITCQSKDKDFDDVLTIHIKGEDKQLPLIDTTITHDFYFDLNTFTVVVGPQKFKTRSPDKDDFLRKNSHRKRCLY